MKPNEKEENGVWSCHDFNLQEKVCYSSFHIFFPRRDACDMGHSFQERHLVPDGLHNQLETIDASLISLNTKMAVIDSVPNKEVGASNLYIFIISAFRFSFI